MHETVLQRLGENMCVLTGVRQWHAEYVIRTYKAECSMRYMIEIRMDDKRRKRGMRGKMMRDTI